MHDHKARKLCSGKTPGGTRQSPVRLGQEQERLMEGLQGFYAEHLGRPVSRSLVVRRALEVLGEQVARQSNAGDQSRVQDEAVKLVKHIR